MPCKYHRLVISKTNIRGRKSPHLLDFTRLPLRNRQVVHPVSRIFLKFGEVRDSAKFAFRR